MATTGSYTFVVSSDGYYYPFESFTFMMSPYSALQSFCTNVFMAYGLIFMCVSLPSSSIVEIIKTCVIAEMRPFYELQLAQVLHESELNNHQQEEKNESDAFQMRRIPSEESTTNMEAFLIPCDADVWDTELWGPAINDTYFDETS